MARKEIKPLKILGLLVVSLLLVACSTSHNIDVSKISTIEVTFSENHKKIAATKYGRSSIELNKTKEWLDNNRDGWEPYIATVAVGNIMIRGEGFTLNTSDDWVILNYDHGSKDYRQLSKKINPSDFNYFSWPSHNKLSKPTPDRPRLFLALGGGAA